MSVNGVYGVLDIDLFNIRWNVSVKVSANYDSQALNQVELARDAVMALEDFIDEHERKVVE